MTIPVRPCLACATIFTEYQQDLKYCTYTADALELLVSLHWERVREECEFGGCGTWPTHWWYYPQEQMSDDEAETCIPPYSGGLGRVDGGTTE